MAKCKTIPTELGEKINEIDSWLFYGDKAVVASRSGKSKTYVGMVFAKKAFCREVIDAGIEVMNENKARFEIKPKLKIA